MTTDNNTSTKTRWSARQLATMALLIALGFVLSFVPEIALFPAAPFLKYDASFVPALLAGFSYGAGSGCLVGVLIAWIHALFDGNFWGALMNTGVVIAFVLPASLIYRVSKGLKTRKRNDGWHNESRIASAVEASMNNESSNMNGNLALILGLIVSALTATLMALLMNLIVTPIYMGVPVDAVMNMMVPILLPFNLIKGLLNSLLSFLLMKSLHSLIVR